MSFFLVGSLTPEDKDNFSDFTFYAALARDARYLSKDCTSLAATWLSK
jgi:hypothetical protein